jgi:serine/threonine protein kinase
MVGSPIYMAPEVLKGEDYGNKADVWSCGVMFYEILFNKCPFEDKTIPRLINKISRSSMVIPKNSNIS